MRRPCGSIGDCRNAIKIVSNRARLEVKTSGKISDRPNGGLMVENGDRVDFDEILLPEDSWEIEFDADEYEVKEILDVRSGRKTRYGRINKHYRVRWKDHNYLTWIDEADLNCGELI